MAKYEEHFNKSIPEVKKEEKEIQTVKPISEKEFNERFVKENGQIVMMDKDGIMNPGMICGTPEAAENREPSSVDKRLNEVFRKHLNEYLDKMIYHRKLNAIGFIQGFAVTQQGVLYASIRDIHYLTPRKITQNGKSFYQYYLADSTWCSFENCMIFCSLEAGHAEDFTNDLIFIVSEFYKSNGKSLDEDLLCYKIDEKMSDKEIEDHNKKQMIKSKNIKKEVSKDNISKEYGGKSNKRELAKKVLGAEAFNDITERCKILTERLKGTRVKNDHALKNKGATAIVDHIYICWEGDHYFKPYVAFTDLTAHGDGIIPEGMSGNGPWWSPHNIHFLHKDAGSHTINYNEYFKDLCATMKKLKDGLTKEQTKMFK